MTMDLSSRADLEALFGRFYESVLSDPVIGFLFTDVAKINMEHHLPVVVDFWEDQVFGTRNYSGGLMAKHVNVHSSVPLKPGHFTRWLHLLDRAIDDSGIHGPNTDRVRLLAHRISKSMSAALSSAKRQDQVLSLGDLINK